MSQRDAVIVQALRTPVGVGKPGKGGLSHTHPGDLGAHVLENLVARAGVDAGLVDDVIWGTVSQVGEQAFNAARNTLLGAGFPESVPGTTIDRQCGSSQQAVHFAAAGLVAGHYDVVIAGGTESMSRVPMFSNAQGGDGPFPPRMLERYNNSLVPQGISAEMIAEKWGLSRQQLDEIAVESHERAAAATDSGAFADEILETAGLTADEGIRRGTTLETLAGLRTVFKEEGGVVTAGNASQISDGGAAVAVSSLAAAEKLGIAPIAKIVAYHTAGVAPKDIFRAPSLAIPAVLAKAKLSVKDIDLFELNEAFAAQSLQNVREVGIPAEKVNVCGGATALGHPIGCSGARVLTTLLHQMKRLNARRGLVALCLGGGNSVAMVVER